MKNLPLKIIGLFVVLSCLYFFLIYFFHDIDKIDAQFGDYIGGILNPLFALLSTSSIILLTYVIAKSESNKADESILAQKRITLNEMRHEALNGLVEKLNLFIHEMDELHFTDSPFKLAKGIIAEQIKAERKEKKQKKKRSFWLIILFEIESFSQKGYLFSELFKSEEFNQTYVSLIDVVNKLVVEHQSEELISLDNLNAYIELKQGITSKIGDYIIKEF
ncbi:MAG: hypothetical protein JXR07_07760 [Reichenbachiella sp.]